MAAQNVPSGNPSAATFVPGQPPITIDLTATPSPPGSTVTISSEEDGEAPLSQSPAVNESADRESTIRQDPEDQRDVTVENPGMVSSNAASDGNMFFFANSAQNGDGATYGRQVAQENRHCQPLNSLRDAPEQRALASASYGNLNVFNAVAVQYMADTGGQGQGRFDLPHLNRPPTSGSMGNYYDGASHQNQSFCSPSQNLGAGYDQTVNLAGFGGASISPLKTLTWTSNHPTAQSLSSQFEDLASSGHGELFSHPDFAPVPAALAQSGADVALCLPADPAQLSVLESHPNNDELAQLGCDVSSGQSGQPERDDSLWTMLDGILTDGQAASVFHQAEQGMATAQQSQLLTGQEPHPDNHMPEHTFNNSLPLVSAEAVAQAQQPEQPGAPTVDQLDQLYHFDPFVHTADDGNGYSFDEPLQLPSSVAGTGGPGVSIANPSNLVNATSSQLFLGLGDAESQRAVRHSAC
ncbi:hypothetical protein HIM_03156 [Hirsutella minnesotensis 3608]|nr:hypothetical protein HIM_03156 [Hirsutella minnesotensis 3608]